MKKYIQYATPPDKWKLPVILLLGIFFGLLLFTVHVSKAPSYLSDKSEVCMNCHIMAPQYATWNRSSHRNVTNCNDCHVPQDNFFRKYLFKAKDGMRHATLFTLRMEPQVIFILEEGSKVVHENCIRCHSDLLFDAKLQSQTGMAQAFRSERKCTDCHRETPHGRVNSLSSVPWARVPTAESPVPEWLSKIMKQ